jgi:hypothetical protein
MYELTRDEISDVYKRFLEVADRKKEVFDEDLRAIMNVHVVPVPKTFVQPIENVIKAKPL